MIKISYALSSILLAATLASCGGPGSGTAERVTSRDSAAAAQTSQAPAAPAGEQQLPPMPVAPKMPDVKPTGWEAFDRHYEQVMRTVDAQLKNDGKLSTEDLEQLRDRAAELAKDANPLGARSAPQRKMLGEQIQRLTDLPASMPTPDRIRAFQPVLMVTREIAQSLDGKDIAPYMEHLQFAAAQLEVLAARQQMQPHQ